jgi:hypothetical protein
MSNAEWTAEILTTMYRVLKPAGFSRRGRAFFRPVGDVVQIVNFMSNDKSTRDWLQCWVRVGVFSPMLHAKMYELGDLWMEITSPRPADAQWSKGLLGEIVPSRDVWWDIRSDAEATAASKEIAELLEHDGLPALERVRSTQALYALWRQTDDGIRSEPWRQTLLRSLEALRAEGKLVEPEP